MMKKHLGRLAMRVEGDFWNAYYALEQTMDGAILLGSIRMAAVRNNEKRRVAFMAMVREMAGDILEDKVGAPVTWNEPERAPEHERAGRA